MKKWGIVVIGMLLCFAACKQEDRKEEVPKQGSEQENVLKDDEWHAEGLSQPTSEKVVELQNGKILENLVAVGVDNPYYCNLEENQRGDKEIEEYRVLLCKDPIYDITYFVNYGKDYFVYAIRDGKAELVVELPASELYCKDGELYFMVEPYGIYQLSGLERGNIVKYNPKDGTVEMVLDEETRDMVVYPDGICYDTHEDWKLLEDGRESYVVHRFFLSFETEQITKFENIRWRRERWREYWLVNEKEGGVSLANPKGEKVRLLKNLDSVPTLYWIKDDSMYYVENDVLMKYCFVTEENEMLAHLGMDEYDDFLMYDDVVYFGNLLRISLEEETQYYAEVKDRVMGNGYFIDAFYSDGEYLYCLNSEQLWRMTEERIAEEGMVKEWIEGRPVTFGCYEYTLHALEAQ